MTLDLLLQEGRRLPANVPARQVPVDAAQWIAGAQRLHAQGGGLLALWGADDRDRDGVFRVFAAFLLPDQVVVLEHALDGANPV